MAQIIWTKKALGQFERAIKYVFKEQGYFNFPISPQSLLQGLWVIEIESF